MIEDTDHIESVAALAHEYVEVMREAPAHARLIESAMRMLPIEDQRAIVDAVWAFGPQRLTVKVAIGARLRGHDYRWPR